VPNIYSDPASYSTKMVWGGNKMVVLNAELLIPLIKEAGIKGLVFFDAGNAYNESEQFFSRPLRMGYGFGFRWFSPIGPLRFEWGYPIQKKSWERASVFEFSIGTFF
jgi:outer membrane protein insertion porin family